MKKTIILFVTLLALLAVPLSAQEATTPTESSVTCCTIRVSDFVLAPNGTSLRVTVDWIRSDGSLKEQRAWGITDGETGVPEDNFLWGNGVAPQPNGIMRAVMFAPTGETGAALRNRFNRRVLAWLRDNNRIGASEIVLP